MSKFSKMLEAQEEFIKALARFQKQEKIHSNKITYEPASFGEVILQIWDQNTAIMDNNELQENFKLAQSIYYHNAIVEHYSEFFDQANKILDGQLEELFFDKEILSKRVMH